MNRTKKNYIPFIAGMATMILLACLISASLAKEDPPRAQPQADSPVQVQAGDLRLAGSEAGVALFGMERVAPGEALKAENGAEFPAVLTCTDEKGEVHYYVEAEAIADILDVAVGVTYREDINCVDFGELPVLDEDGKQRVTGPDKKPVWSTGKVKCDIEYILTYDDSGKPIAFARDMPLTLSSGITFASGSASTHETEEERADRLARAEQRKQAAPLKPEYGVTSGMYTEVDPAEVDMASWSGTAMKSQKFRSENGEEIQHSFAFTPYLGEYALITIENTGTADAWVRISRPCTVGNRNDVDFTGGLCVPAGQKVVRAFRIDDKRPLENQLDLRANAYVEGDIELTLTAEQYRFGK